MFTTCTKTAPSVAVNASRDAPSELQAMALIQVCEGIKPGPLHAWFTAGIESYLNGTTLEVALGLTGGAGRRTARTLYRRAKRDAALRLAHGLMPGETPWRRSLALVPEVRRFATALWPRWRHLDAPPPQASALRAALFAAFKNGPPPSSATGLHAVCNLL